MAGSKNKIVIPYEESHKLIDGVEFKLCNKCFKWFPLNLDNFYKNKCSIDGYFPSCKECEKRRAKKYQSEHVKEQAIRHAKWYRENTEKALSYCIGWNHQNKDRLKKLQKIWQKENPDKCKQNNEKYSNKKHSITKTEWENCLKYFNYTCAYCGISQEEAKEKQGNNLHKEHVNHEGSNGLENCVPSCKVCNSTKRAKKFHKWYILNNPVFDEQRLNKINKWLNEDYKHYLD